MATRLDSVNVDCADAEALGRWWAATLDWPIVRHEWTDGRRTTFEFSVDPPHGRPGVSLTFANVAEGKVGFNRVHVDLRSGSASEQVAMVVALEQRGARRIDIGQGDVPFVVLADPEGNEFCVLDRRDDYEHTGQIAAIVMKALDPISLAPFWSAATGWDVVVSTPGYAALEDQRQPGPLLELIATNESHRVKNRWHLDVRPDTSSDRDVEVGRLLDLGATRVEVGQAYAAPGEVTWVVLADPEGNEFCVLRGIDEPKARAVLRQHHRVGGSPDR